MLYCFSHTRIRKKANFLYLCPEKVRKSSMHLYKKYNEQRFGRERNTLLIIIKDKKKKFIY